MKHGKFENTRIKTLHTDMDQENKEKSVCKGCYKNDIQIGFWTEEYNMYGKSSINSFKESMYI